MEVPTDEREMLRVLDALIAGAKRIHVTHADDSDFDQVVGALKYRVMHYYDTDDDIINTPKVVKDVSDWESWTPTDPLQAFLKMGVNVFVIQYRGRRL
jgi:hypothetical protein